MSRCARIGGIIDLLKERVERIGWQAMAEPLPIAEPIVIADVADALSDYLAGDAGGETGNIHSQINHLHF